MTLIEVVAGLALLAALLIGILAARERSSRQWARANQRLQAVAAADALLSSWWREPARFPRSASGRVQGHPRLFWSTRVVRNPAVEQLGAQTVRLQIVTDPVTVDGATPDPTGSVLGAVVIIDVVLPPEAEAPEL